MAQKKTTTKTQQAPLAHAVGRRKNAVARVWVRRGAGKIVVNGTDSSEYFDTKITRDAAATPFRVYPVGLNYDIQANVCGGGKVGQADAIKLGIARALTELDETIRPLMRQNGLLTVDSRKKERKKYGRRGARRRFQFVKR
jgi:small subunit ribosomal protein S9